MDWYPRNPRHYRRKTRGLTLAAHGAYCLLIDEYMDTEEPLPDNDRALAAVCGCSVDEWLEVADEVRTFFDPKGGKLSNKRCDEELRIRGGYQRAISEGGKKGAKRRWAEHNKNKALATPPKGQAKATPEAPPVAKDSTLQDTTGQKKEEKYIWQGKIVRLTQTDYDDWKRAYHTLDLPAELQRLDDYYHRNLAGANRPSWYERCSGALGKKHRELTQARKVDLPFAKVGMTDEEAAAVRERVLGQ